MNDTLYRKYNTKTLEKINKLLDKRIEMVKISRIAVEMQKERITTYAFIKSVINNELSTK
jgi:hypothetical protein